MIELKIANAITVRYPKSDLSIFSLSVSEYLIITSVRKLSKEAVKLKKHVRRLVKVFFERDVI